MKLLKFSNLLFILVTCSIWISCDNSEDYSAEEIDYTKIDIKTFHDDYCDLVCDSFSIWREHNELNEDKIKVLWSSINSTLSSELNLSLPEVDSIFSVLGISVHNYTHVYDNKYPLLNSRQKLFIDDLELLMLNNFNSSDKLLLDSLEIKRIVWKKLLPSNEVDVVIDISRSSMIYWKNNVEECVLNEDIFRWRRNQRGAAKLAVGDAVGGLWGLWGGPVGALLGAVGGTLGSAIQMAIFGV